MEVKFYPSKKNNNGGLLVVNGKKYSVWNNNGFLLTKTNGHWKLIAVKLQNSIKILPESLGIHEPAPLIKMDKMVRKNIALTVIARKLQEMGVEKQWEQITKNGKVIRTAPITESDLEDLERGHGYFYRETVQALKRAKIKPDKVLNWIWEVQEELLNKIKIKVSESEIAEVTEEEYGGPEFAEVEEKVIHTVSIVTILKALGFSESELLEVVEMLRNAKPFLLNTWFESIKVRPESRILRTWTVKEKEPAYYPDAPVLKLDF